MTKETEVFDRIRGMKTNCKLDRVLDRGRWASATAVWAVARFGRGDGGMVGTI